MAAPGSGRARSSSWQEKLQDHCQTRQLHAPVFNIVSDRRGGRTAWSSTCTFPSPSSPSAQQTVQARYWYDGQYVHNAREDAAEVALGVLTGSGSAGSTGPRSPASPTGSFGGSVGSMNGGSTGGIGVAWPVSPSGRW